MGDRIERVRQALAMRDADYDVRPDIEDIGNLLHQYDRLRAELAAAREALKPFADLRVTRFMTGGLRYNFRVDAAWIRKAKTVGGMED